MMPAPIKPSDLLYVSGNYTRQPDASPATPVLKVGVVERSGGRAARLWAAERRGCRHHRSGRRVAEYVWCRTGMPSPFRTA